MVDIEPILHVNQSVWTPDFSFCQILAVRPPQHQRGLSSSHNTPSVCSPVVPVRQVLPSPSSACLLEFDNTCVSVRLSPDFFQFRNVVPACYRSTKSLVFVHIRQDQILSLLFCESHFFFFCVFPRSLCFLSTLSAAFSSAGLRCCCTVRRNTELQVDQKPLQHRTAVSFSVSHPHNSSRATEKSRSGGKEATAEVEEKGRGGLGGV